MIPARRRCAGSTRGEVRSLEFPRLLHFRREASKSETYNQEDAGYATIDGKRYEAHVHEIASWHTIIGGGAGQMEAKYENRLCELTLMTGDEQFTTGVAYNERYLGTLW